MLNKKHSRRSLAIFVALALGSGAFFAPASPAAAADVTIDASNPPSDNVTGSGDNGSAAGVVTDMTSAAEVSGNTMTFRGYNYSGKSIYGGFTHGTGRVHGNIVDIYGGAMQSAYGGAAMLGGNAERNEVAITGGTIGGSVYGGFSTGNGDVTGNKVHLTGTTVNGSVYGGYGAHKTNDNEVYLNGDVNITRDLYGGNSTSASMGNKLFVEGKDNKAAKVDGFQQMTFKTDGVAEGQTMLQVTGTAKTKVDWEKLEATGAATGITLLRNDHDIILSNYTYYNNVKSKLSADGKSEYDIEVVDVAGHARKITYNRYQFEGNRTLSRSPNRLGVMMTWGGLSLVSNTTKKNIVTLDHSVAGVHQYIYGGWSRHLNANSSGDGDSTENELTIAETAVLAGSSVWIYGGYAEAGKAEGNTVTIKRNVNGLIQGGHSGGNNSAVKNIVHVGNVTITGEVVGGSSSDTANENEVHLTGTTVIGNVSGGAIRMSGGDTNAKDNKVYLNGGVTIQGGLYGGDTDDISEGNKLFVKGKDNKAGLVEQFQKMEFDTTGVNQEDTMLTATNGTATNDINWDTLDVKGTAANGKITLLKNMAGINLTGTTAGQSRSTLNEDGKSEQNLAVVNGDPSDTGKVTAIIAESYQFKDKTTTSSVTESGLTTTWGGRSIAGNTTTGNEITVGSGNHTNVYGGWTTGAGSTTAGEEALRHSIDNKVTVNGSANVSDTVYGGYTDVTGGRATGNKVKIDKIILGKVIGGKSADGEASGNTVTVNADTRTVVGGEAQGAATGNTVEVNANTTRVIGGNSTGAAASGNTVTVNASPNDVTGGKSTGGEASGNVVNFGNVTVYGNIVGGDSTAVTNSNTLSLTQTTVMRNVTGGRGAVANENIVNLDSANVRGTITGGAADGTGNTLNVKGTNAAGNVAGFQKVNFDATGVTSGATMLNLTIGATTLDKSAIDATGATVAGGITLLHNGNGIAVNGLGATDNILKSETDATTEKNIAALKSGSTITDIRYEGYQFAHVTTPVIDGTDAYGGISKAGNSTHDNAITVNGDYTNVYGGHTSGSGTTRDDKDNSYSNTVTITGGRIGAVYGGYTDAAAGTTTGNTVNIGDGTNALAAGTTIDEIHGGNRSQTGNKLVVNATATVGKVENFEKFVFNYKEAMAANPMLTLTGGASSLRLDAIEANGTVTETPATLVHNAAGLTIADYEDKPKSMLNADGTRETNLDVKKIGTLLTDIIRYAYTFKGATAATTVGTDTWGGRSAAGNTTTENTITVASGTHTNIYGGWTTGAGSTAAGEGALKNSTDNKVTVSGTAAVTGTVYGGFTDAAGGKAHKNTVTINKTITGKVVGGEAEGEATYNTVNINQSAGDVIGGKSAGAAASNNIINIKANSGAVTGGKSMGAEASRNIINIENAITGAVTGGDGTKTDSNTVNLTNTTVNGTITGGTADGDLGNTLTVKGKNTAQNIKGFRMVEFHADTADTATETPLLTLITGETTLAGKDVINVEGSTASGKITLLHNANGINIEGYTGGDPLQSKTTDTTEKNVSVLRNSSGKITDITYEGYQFSKVESFVEKAVATGKEAYGGISKAGNTTSYNKITVNGNYEAVYGGHTSGSGSDQIGDLKNHSFRNTVTITGGTIGKVYGGYTESADGTTTFNTVSLGDGTNALADGTTIAEIHGGNKAATKNTLVVNAKAQVGTISNFDKVTFNYKESMGNDPMLTLTQADAKFDLNTIDATFDAKATPVTLVHNENGLTLEGYTEGAVKSTLNADGTQETNIDVRKTGTRNTDVIRYAYTFKGKNTASSATESGITSTWGGRSVAGNTTTGNMITVGTGNHTNIYGGWTTGAGSTAAADRRGASKENSVTVNGSATVTGTIYGGYTDALDGAALKNTVTLEKDLTGSVVAGFSASGEASGNIVNLTGRTFTGNITGGHGTRTNDNIIRLKDAAVTGTVTGGTAANGTGNTLAVAYGTGTSSIGDFSGIRNIHFDLENAPLDDTTHTLLKLTNVSGANKTLSNLNIEFERLSAAKRFKKGDSLTLMENASGAFTLGDNVTSKDVDGVLRKYTFEVAPEAGNPSKLTLTVTKAGITEQAKSLVETRAGLASFVNQGGDYLVASGLAAAEMSAGSRSTAADADGKDGKRPTASADSAAYQLWAGAGANNMRAESGSYVDSKGWSLGVGWAREDAKKDGSKLLFSPFIEYGRGTYDSYLDDGTHGSGKMSYIGVGILGKLTLQDGMWFEGSVRGGRAKSDYSADLSGTATSYDGSNTYCGIHLGLGKTFALQEGSAIDGYLRYFWSHQNGMRASVKTGGSADDTFDFGSVNSHRLRLGLRYSHKDKNAGELYAGLAWEYEFDGKAGATMDGEAAPSPSLKGASGMLELGYRFMPENSRVSYDLHLNGWQGKRKGISGGVAVKWAF